MPLQSATVLLILTMTLLSACRPVTHSIGYQIVGVFPHDSDAFTQGLLFHDGYLFESTGRYGQSGLRKIDTETGRIMASTRVAPDWFAEGLARVESELIQLTWKAGIALVYDLETLELKRQHTYTGEGWGLCYDGVALFMSDGSSRIVLRDPETFDIISWITVTQDGNTQSSINELECVGQSIYANIYPTDRIIQIDKHTGKIINEINGLDFLSATQRPDNPRAVLNGIAYVPQTGIFLVTGKLWPKLLAIQLNNHGTP